VLRRLLAELRTVRASGGWGTVAEGPTLHPGEADARVPFLRHRLTMEGDLPPADTAGTAGSETYDDALAAAVRRFQRRHGLEDDGNVGRGTVAAMNVPVEERLRQVVVNMERWRWLPDELGRRHIRVNIADYSVEVWEEGKVTLAMKAVVGREYRETPMFSAKMTYVVLSPYWNVPPVIAALDKLPLLRKNPGYLAAQHMVLFDAAKNTPVDPATVDFAAMTGSAFNRLYRIRQDPGPLNALGEVKFMFPNRHNVYLHDTPSRELFAKTSRAFSSGCIRVEKPLALADYLLAGDPRWTPERIRTVISQGRETTVWLNEAVPVHILYWTAFVEDDGVVDFRPDIYGRDQAVRRALDADPPPN
jgi:murein L,D-transpeptidase YcbB/YkuD